MDNQVETILDTLVEERNIALAPEEIAMLNTLMEQYNQVLMDVEVLNSRLEELLEAECPKKSSELEAD